MRKNILLVEDEKNIILGVRTCLDAAGYKVEVAENGEMALEAVRRKKPDLILLDLVMPKCDGFEVLENLKNEPETSKIPVVVLTAKAGEEDRKRAIELGADAYMTKPFRPQELWDVLKNFLPDNDDH
ncbi:MAG TPA: response regulator [Bacillota bacterium]|jgi:DNA-binding response OmpR family regulator|nr:response regulator [Bacillota bacterium]HOA36069.1 response regulator [Bacillota bacterium]HOJ84052.1 response regulator [Bacillota bacterium]HOL16187.1 response regulator [Bacillota bacterium]HPZ11456.1 response regulator [Bacillota bacterium]